EHYRSIDLAPRIAIPVTLVQAEFDSVIPAANTERLWQAFRPGIATRVLMRGAGHNDVDGAAGYVEALQGQ
ncbi:MAG: alpha/beta hydrolase, partial [Massilia sp.]